MKYIKEFKDKMSEVIQDFSDIYIEEICEKFGEKLSGKLNRGSFGTAYRLRSGKVLKITSDRVEAFNSSKLIGMKNKHIINIYDVKEIKLENDNGSIKVYGILIDYVRPLNNIEKQVFNNIKLYFFDFDQDLRNRTRNVLTYLGSVYSKEDILETLDKFIRSKGSMLIEGAELGIRYSEAHQENLGFNKEGYLVYFDLGWSESVEVDSNHEIQKIIIGNKYTELTNVLEKNFEPNKAHPLREVVKTISKEMNISLSKSYKLLRDEVYNEYFVKSGLKDEYRTLSVKDYYNRRSEIKYKLSKYFIYNNSILIDLDNVSKDNLKSIFFVYI